MHVYVYVHVCTPYVHFMCASTTCACTDVATCIKVVFSLLSYRHSPCEVNVHKKTQGYMYSCRCGVGGG